MSEVLRYRSERRDPLGSVVGVRWDAATGRLLVLDAQSGVVTTFDRSGGVASSFGRVGHGPGEFEELAGQHGSRAGYNQLALAPAGYIAVNDLGLLHVFDRQGRFVDRIGTGGARAGPFGMRQVTAWSDSTFLYAETGAGLFGSGDQEVRASARLVEVKLDARRLDTTTVALIHNTLRRLPTGVGLPPPDPYGAAYARTWDAAANGVLAMVSFSTTVSVSSGRIDGCSGRTVSGCP